MNSDILFSSLNVLSFLIPVIIVWVIGIALALSRWKRHPKVSLFAIIAFVVMIGSSVIFRVISAMGPMMMAQSGWAPSEMGPVFAVIGIVSTLITAVAWALILCAIFGWRARPQMEKPYTPATSGFSQP
jgi:hypothetical protein